MAEHCYAECHMLSVVTLSVVKLSVVMLSVVAPISWYKSSPVDFFEYFNPISAEIFKIQIRERAMTYKTNYGRKFGPILMPEERQNLKISSRKMLFIKVCDEK